MSCEYCGSDNTVHNEHWQCGDCGETLAGNQTRSEELRELIQQWRAKQDWHREQSITKGDGGKQWQTFKECADELEALLDE